MSHLTDFQDKCNKIVKLVNDDLSTVKTGRAKPSLVESIKVQVYGDTWMEIRELASISATDAQSLVISPWDKSVLKDLEKGIATSEINLNPIVDGDVIRINIPALTEERRREYVKLVHQKVESHKAMLRSERTSAKKNIESEKNIGGVSEDDVKNNLKKLQDITDDTVSKIDKIAKAKEDDIMKI